MPRGQAVRVYQLSVFTVSAVVAFRVRLWPCPSNFMPDITVEPALLEMYPSGAMLWGDCSPCLPSFDSFCCCCFSYSRSHRLPVNIPASLKASLLQERPVDDTRTCLFYARHFVRQEQPNNNMHACFTRVFVWQE
jgi:hypothetical protein